MIAMGLYLCLFIIGMYFAVKIEKTKRTYQKVLLAAGSAFIIVIIAFIMIVVMRIFS